MTAPGNKASRWWLLIGGGVLVVAAAASAGFYFTHRTSATPALADPNQLWEQMRRTDLTDAERDALREQMRAAWEARIDKRLNEYYTASSQADKDAILDRHIEEMDQDRQDWERRRAEREKEGATTQPTAGQQGPRRPGRPNFAAMSTQERKARSESRNPDQRARMMAYFSALRARAAERGIQLPMGPGGGPGGPGRGMGGGPPRRP